MTAYPNPLIDGPRLAPITGGKPTGLVVLLHGYGSNGQDLISLARVIQPSLPEIAFVAPDAPSLMPRMANAHQWWPIQSFSAAERGAGVAGAAPDLDRFLSDELKSHGLGDDRLLIVGFSQGAMMALHVGLRRRHPIAGIIGISGMLVDQGSLEAEITNRPPVLLIHGTADDVVPFRSLELASKALDAAGVPVTTHVSSGLGHSVDQEGLAAAAAFVARVLP